MVTTIVHSSFPAAHSTGATHYKQLVAVGVLWQRPRIGPVMRSKHRPYGAVRQRSALSALITRPLLLPCAPRVHHPRWSAACRSHAASLLKELCSCRHARHTSHRHVITSNDHGCMSAEAHLQAHSSRHGSRDGHRSQSRVKIMQCQAALHPLAPTIHERRRHVRAGCTCCERTPYRMCTRKRARHSP